MSIIIRNKEPKTYIIIGAPHSATSFVSKAIESLGVDMGTDMYSHYQDTAFVNLNRHILRHAGGDAYNPPTDEAISTVDDQEYIKELLKKKKKKFWGWKDPPTALTFHKYRPYLEDDVYLIAIFRNPEKLVESYKDRENGRITRELVDKYNKTIIKQIKRFCKL